MEKDLERRLPLVLVKLKIQNASYIWRRDGFGLSLHFIPSLQSACYT